MSFEHTHGLEGRDHAIRTAAKFLTKKTIATILGCLVLLGIVIDGTYTVPEAERGLLFSAGKYEKTVDPGFHFKVPFYQTVKTISLQSWTDSYAKLWAYSADGQKASMAVSVTWADKPDKVDEMYRDVLNLDNVTTRYVKTLTPTELENSFGKYESETLFDKRDGFVQTLRQNLAGKMPDYISVVGVQVENVDFSDDWEKSVENRARAKVDAKTAKDIETRRTVENRVKVATAQADADSRYKQLEAEAKGIKAKALAEAEGIKAKGDALRANPGLVDLIKAERWNGATPTHVLPTGTVPFLDTK